MKSLLLALLPALLFGACAAPPPPVAGAQGARGAVAAACQQEAERVVRYRDRGQLMRQDDYNARIGTSSYLGPQVISDGYAQIYDRDRMIASCVRGATAAEPARGAAVPSGAPAGR